MDSKFEISVPSVEVPCIEFIPHNDSQLYVKMNLRSTARLPLKARSFWGSKHRTIYYRGFLLLVQTERKRLPDISQCDSLDNNLLSTLSTVEISRPGLPKIEVVGNDPPIYHPHFNRDGIWVDYKEDVEEDLISYIYRVAQSIMYKKGFIHDNAINKDALEHYYRNTENFPSDTVELLANTPVEPDTTTGGDAQAQGMHSSVEPDTDDVEPDTITGSDAQAQGIHSSPDIPEQSDDTDTTVKPDTDDSTQAQAISPPCENLPQTKRKARFEIRETKPAYSPIDRDKTNQILEMSLHSDVRIQQDFSSSHEFYLEYSAFEAISNHIGWSQRTQNNQVEQGGILLGDVFRDPKTNVTYGIVQEAIAGRLAQGTSSYLSITHQTWKKMLDEADELNKNLQVIGWYHTHPNSLDVFMSGTDRATQESFFGENWQFAIVLNPQREIWRSFYGAKSIECRGYVIAPKS